MFDRRENKMSLALDFPPDDGLYETAFHEISQLFLCIERRRPDVIEELRRLYNESQEMIYPEYLSKLQVEASKVIGFAFPEHFRLDDFTPEVGYNILDVAKPQYLIDLEQLAPVNHGTPYTSRWGYELASLRWMNQYDMVAVGIFRYIKELLRYWIAYPDKAKAVVSLEGILAPRLKGLTPQRQPRSFDPACDDLDKYMEEVNKYIDERYQELGGLREWGMFRIMSWELVKPRRGTAEKGKDPLVGYVDFVDAHIGKISLENIAERYRGRDTHGIDPNTVSKRVSEVRRAIGLASQEKMSRIAEEHYFHIGQTGGELEW